MGCFFRFYFFYFRLIKVNKEKNFGKADFPVLYFDILVGFWLIEGKIY